jgi:hypothetical protein
VDGTLAMAALGYRLQLRERIPAYMGAEVQLRRWSRVVSLRLISLLFRKVTTPCLYEEVSALGESHTTPATQLADPHSSRPASQVVGQGCAEAHSLPPVPPRDAADRQKVHIGHDW